MSIHAYQHRLSRRVRARSAHGLGTPAAAAAQASRGALARGTFAITDVAVVPMTSGTVLAAATVVVRDGRIVALGPSPSVVVPEGVRRIDGRGKH